jgi:hypothetical protein
MLRYFIIPILLLVLGGCCACPDAPLLWASCTVCPLPANDGLLQTIDGAAGLAGVSHCRASLCGLHKSTRQRIRDDLQRRLPHLAVLQRNQLDCYGSAGRRRRRRWWWRRVDVDLDADGEQQRYAAVDRARSTYNSYLLDCNGLIPVTLTANLLLQFGERGTLTWETAGVVTENGVSASGG